MTTTESNTTPFSGTTTGITVASPIKDVGLPGALDRQQILALIDQRFDSAALGEARDFVARLRSAIDHLPDPDDGLPGRPGDVDGERWCRGSDVPAVGWEWVYAQNDGLWRTDAMPRVNEDAIVICRPIPEPVITITIPRALALRSSTARWVTGDTASIKNACTQALKDTQ